VADNVDVVLCGSLTKSFAAEAMLVSALGHVPTGVHAWSCSSHSWLNDAARYNISLMVKLSFLLSLMAMPVGLASALLRDNGSVASSIPAASTMCLLLLVIGLLVNWRRHTQQHLTELAYRVVAEPWPIWSRQPRTVTITPRRIAISTYAQQRRDWHASSSGFRSSQLGLADSWEDMGWAGHLRRAATSISANQEDNDDIVPLAGPVLDGLRAAAETFEVERAENPMGETLLSVSDRTRETAGGAADVPDVDGEAELDPETAQRRKGRHDTSGTPVEAERFEVERADSQDEPMTARERDLVAQQQLVEEELHLQRSDRDLSALPRRSWHKPLLTWCGLWAICVAFVLWILLASPTNPQGPWRLGLTTRGTSLSWGAVPLVLLIIETWSLIRTRRPRH
jgi:hypothetical protein